MARKRERGRGEGKEGQQQFEAVVMVAVCEGDGGTLQLQNPNGERRKSLFPFFHVETAAVSRNKQAAVVLLLRVEHAAVPVRK